MVSIKCVNCNLSCFTNVINCIFNCDKVIDFFRTRSIYRNGDCSTCINSTNDGNERITFGIQSVNSTNAQLQPRRYSKNSHRYVISIKYLAPVDWMSL